MSDTDPTAITLGDVMHELQLVNERLDRIDRRLDEGERRFKSQDDDWTIAMRYLESVNNHLGRKAEAGEIDGVIAERRESSNGAGDAPTNPGRER